MASLYYSEKELSNIKKYKAGVTIDKSLTYQFIVSPFCAKLVTILPTWLAPNVLTLFGLLCNIVAFSIAALLIADNPTPPPWTYLACAFLIWAYMIADNSDGKQAFRTGSSSPLGEALDHGCDSMVVALGSLTTGYIIGANTYQILLWAAYGYLAFYLAHWQEYFVHYLELGYLNGPTEAETFAILIYILTFFVGREWWQTAVTIYEYQLTPCQILSTILTGTLIFTIFSTILKGSDLAVKKNINLIGAYTQLIPLTTSWIAGFVWFYFDPSVYFLHPNFFLVGTNFIFSYLTINCIVQRMCNLSYRYFYAPTIPLFIGAANSYIISQRGFGFIDNQILMFASVLFWFVVFAHFSVTTTIGLCQQLGINALTIPYPNKATKSQ